jgi:single-strand DNA-binding protein
MDGVTRRKAMSRDMNSVVIVGRLTRDPEFKTTQSGKELLKFSIANNRKSGERDETSYFDVSLWGKFAAVMKDYLERGKQVIVQGRLVQNRWEQDGQTRSKVEIVADNLQLIGGNAGGGQGGQRAPQQGGNSGGLNEPDVENIPF